MKKMHLSKVQLVTIRLLIAVVVGLIIGFLFCYLINPSSTPDRSSWEPGLLGLCFFIVIFVEIIFTQPNYLWYGFISHTIAYGIFLYFVCDLGLFDGYTTYISSFDPEFIIGKGRVLTEIKANYDGWYIMFGVYGLRLFFQIHAFLCIMFKKC